MAVKAIYEISVFRPTENHRVKPLDFPLLSDENIASGYLQITMHGARLSGTHGVHRRQSLKEKINAEAHIG